MGVVLYLFINLSNYYIYSGVLMMLGHGYIRTILFFLVGEFYLIFSRRLVYKVKGLWVNVLFVCSMWQLVLILNSGSPVTLSFLSEILFVRGSCILHPWSLYLLIIYYVVSFYFIMWLIIITILGFYKRDFFVIPLFIIFPYLFLVIGIFV